MYQDRGRPLRGCMNCLYGLRDLKRLHHDCPQVDLKWENCAPLYEYLIPKKLPEYDLDDPYAGMEDGTLNILFRILDLAPKELKPKPNKTQPILDYIEGGKELPPDFSSSSQTTDPIMQSIYYLFAHWQFKTSQFVYVN